MPDVKNGTWEDLRSAIKALHASCPVRLWWREPASDASTPSTTECLGQGLPYDLETWPAPLECWFWCGSTDEPGKRRALHGVRGEAQAPSQAPWQWLELGPPADLGPDGFVWTLNAADVKRYGVSLPAGMRLVRSADAARGWLWLGLVPDEEWQ